MPDSVFTYRMPAGVPGEVSRLGGGYGATIKTEMQNVSTPATLFGQVVTVDSDGVRPITGTDSSAPTTPLGFTVRPFPGTDYTIAIPSGTPPANQVPFGAGTPAARGLIDVMLRGYMTVKLNGAAAAAKGAPVYVYYGSSTGSHVQSGVEAAAGANLWALPGAYFQGPADASGNVEIAFNL